MLPADTGSVDALEVLLRRLAWMRDALCQEPAHRGLPWVYEHGVSQVMVARMSSVCAHCLVSNECLAYARAHPDVVGYWAGTTAQDRRQARVQVRAASTA